MSACELVAEMFERSGACLSTKKKNAKISIFFGSRRPIFECLKGEVFCIFKIEREVVRLI